MSASNVSTFNGMPETPAPDGQLWSKLYSPEENKYLLTSADAAKISPEERMELIRNKIGAHDLVKKMITDGRVDKGTL